MPLPAYDVWTRPFGVYVYEISRRGVRRVGRFSSERDAWVWIGEVINGAWRAAQPHIGWRERRSPSEGRGRRACQERLREQFEDAAALSNFQNEYYYLGHELK